MLIVGLDAATKPSKVGYALGSADKGKVRVIRAGTLRTSGCPDALSEYVVPELKKAKRALIAIDAPLGWPALAGTTYSGHAAGDLVPTSPDRLFHRATDEFVWRKLRKRPFEVGANLIARTAHAALGTLDKLRKLTGQAIPLVWTPDFNGTAAIEVYPGASVRAWGCTYDGYRVDPEVRRRMASSLSGRITDLADDAIASIDAFDATLCLLAGQDFLEGATWSPEEDATARKEGWIWFRRSDVGAS